MQPQIGSNRPISKQTYNLCYESHATYKTGVDVFTKYRKTLSANCHKKSLWSRAFTLLLKDFVGADPPVQAIFYAWLQLFSPLYMIAKGTEKMQVQVCTYVGTYCYTICGQGYSGTILNGTAHEKCCSKDDIYLGAGWFEGIRLPVVVWLHNCGMCTTTPYLPHTPTCHISASYLPHLPPTYHIYLPPACMPHISTF